MAEETVALILACSRACQITPGRVSRTGHKHFMHGSDTKLISAEAKYNNYPKMTYLRSQFGSTTKTFSVHNIFTYLLTYLLTYFIKLIEQITNLP